MEIIINSPDNPVFFHIFNYPVRYYGVILSIAILTDMTADVNRLNAHFPQAAAKNFAPRPKSAYLTVFYIISHLPPNYKGAR